MKTSKAVKGFYQLKFLHTKTQDFRLPPLKAPLLVEGHKRPFKTIAHVDDLWPQNASDQGEKTGLIALQQDLASFRDRISQARDRKSKLVEHTHLR